MGGYVSTLFVFILFVVCLFCYFVVLTAGDLFWFCGFGSLDLLFVWLLFGILLFELALYCFVAGVVEVYILFIVFAC